MAIRPERDCSRASLVRSERWPLLGAAVVAVFLSLVAGGCTSNVATDGVAETDVESDATAPDVLADDVAPVDDAESGGEVHPAADAKSPLTVPDGMASDVKLNADGGTADAAGAQGDASQDDATSAPDTAQDTAPEPTPTVASPTLTQLQLEGIEFVAPFDPNVHDYAAYCAAGKNAWNLHVTAAPGGAASVIAPIAQAVDANGIAALDVADGGVVVVRGTSSDGAQSDYFVRCLPHDFPHMKFTSKVTPDAGYYLLGSTPMLGGSGTYNMVLNSAGTPVWYHTTGTGIALTELPAPNVLVYSAPLPGESYLDANHRYVVHDLAKGTKQDIVALGMATDQHEVQPTGGGKFIIFAGDMVTGVDMSSRGITNTKAISDCVLQEFNPDGSLAWQWRASEHVDPVTECTDFFPMTIGGQPVMDVYHCNSVAQDPSGNLLLSMRHTDGLYMISRATGAVMWKLGGAVPNKDTKVHIKVTGDAYGGFFHQHDARLMPNGNITMFDNQTTKDGNARGLELKVNVAAKQASVVWQIQGAATGAAMGAMQTLADGVRLVTWGIILLGTPKLIMTETDATGAPIRDLTFLTNDIAYRVQKVPMSALNIDLLRGAIASRLP